MNLIALAIFLIFSSIPEAAASERLPADISFLIADLKYSESEGVKICEVQPGSLSKFSGYDFLMGDEGLVARSFCDVLERYQKRVWFVKNGVCDPKMKIEYHLRGYIEKMTIRGIAASQDFKDAAKSPLYNPYSVNSYAGAVYSSLWFPGDIGLITDKHPSILLIDRAFLPFFRDKERMSSLFLHDPELVSIKPRWKTYHKHYRPELAKEILEDMGSETVVIKPIRSSKGYGVLIVSGNELDSVLKQLLIKSSTLSLHKDEEFRHWATDTSPKFIVETFHPSDPVAAPLLGEGRFDPTMRVVFFLILNDEKLEFVFVEAHWKLPKISIDAEGSLTLKHKSYGERPHFLLVEDEVIKKVEEVLKERLLLFYKRALNLTESNFRRFSNDSLMQREA